MRGTLRSPEFTKLLAGTAVSSFGDAVSPVVLAFCLLQATGSVVDLGLVVGSRALAHVAFLGLAGTLADRFPRSRVLLLSCLASAASQLGLALCVSFAPHTVLLVVTAASVNGATTAFSGPAAAGLLPETVPPDQVVPANALFRVGVNATSILGTIAAAVLVGFVAPSVGLYLDALTFVVASAVFSRLRRRAQTSPTAREALWSSMAEGWSLFWGTFWIKATVGAFAVVNFAFASAYFVLGPALAVEGIGRSQWSLVVAGQGVGFLVGGVASTRMRERNTLTQGLAWASTFAVFLVALSRELPVGWLLAASVVAGVGLERFNVCWQVVLQTNVPREFLSRISSYDQMGSFIAIPAGEIASGLIASLVGVRVALVIYAIVCVVVCVGLAISPRIRTVGITNVPATGSSACWVS